MKRQRSSVAVQSGPAEPPFAWYGISQRLGITGPLDAEATAVLELVALGVEEPRIARELGLSPRRAGQVIAELLALSGARSRAHLVTRAILVGYLTVAGLRVADERRWPTVEETEEQEP